MGFGQPFLELHACGLKCLLLRLMLLLQDLSTQLCGILRWHLEPLSEQSTENVHLKILRAVVLDIKEHVTNVLEDACGEPH